MRAVAAAQTLVKDAAAEIALNVTKSSLVENLGGSTTRNIDGVIYTITHDQGSDSIKVVDRQNGMEYVGKVGAKDNRIRIDTSAGTKVASSGLPSFEDLQQALKADGPGPEIINGRVAMLAFIGTIGVELVSQRSFVEQIATPEGAAAAGVLSLLTLAASIAPCLVGNATPVGCFPSPNDPYADRLMPYYFSQLAEIINGRVAMIGMAALIANEAFRGAPLF